MTQILTSANEIESTPCEGLEFRIRYYPKSTNAIVCEVGHGLLDISP